jgi:hypothetical protein
MTKKFIYAGVFAGMLVAGSWWLVSAGKKVPVYVNIKPASSEGVDEESNKALFVKERMKYEFDMVKDPVSGKIPIGIREKEIELAKSIPQRELPGTGLLSPTVNNTYSAAGPINQGGRTRAIAFDKRFGTGGNQVIIAGAVSGGIFRSTDGGATWTKVTPEGEVHNVTAIAQDPRPGSQDTWYAGGGEALGNSASGFGAFYFGQGVWKSTNNGATWSRLTLDVTGIPVGAYTLEGFDNVFDIVHDIEVNPANGHVYIAGHRRLIRSTNGGTSFEVVFAGTTPASADQGQMDVEITDAGKIYLGVNGSFRDAALRGLWSSTTGNNGLANWTRIAGGQTENVDSLNNWRGNAPDDFSRKIVLALAPSNQNILYVCYENGLSQESANGANPEVDLYKIDFTTNTYFNRSANMPDFPGQINVIDPIAIQEGYDLMIAVKPDNPDVVFIGGTNLYRSTDGFASTTNTEWIGGYRKGQSIGFNLPTHPDIHALVFDPTNANRAICANDGGLQVTNNIMTADPEPNIVSWTHLDNYQTMQYYHVAIDPSTNLANFIGGAQDNGTYIRQQAANPANEQDLVAFGDGGATAIAAFTGQTNIRFFSSSQLGSINRQTASSATGIRPTIDITANPGGGFGEFVTYYKMDFDNVEDLYYANFNKIFRTTSASTVTGSTWTYLSGVASTINPANANGTNIGIRALELSRGPYVASHVLYIGTTNGKVFRLDNPRNAPATATPVDITPVGLNGNISDIAVNPNNDDEVLLTVSNYAATSLFWTKNAKSASPVWKNAEGNLTLPSFRSCMIVVKKDASGTPVQEYYVGTSVGLYSATNIGATLDANGTVSWAREGGATLGFAVIQSMDYRPQDNTLLLGTHGNGMYFTNVGTPNFTPNQNTGIDDPVRNDKNFIQKAFPTVVAANSSIEYRIGNMFTIKRLVVQVHNTAGQLVYRKEDGYQNGVIDVSRIAKGAYVLTITSSDNKQQFIQQFVKQ